MPKRHIRRKLLAKRLLHQGKDEKKTKDKKIATLLENTEEFRNAKSVLFYASAHGEVDTHNLIQKYIDKKNLYLPRAGENFYLHIHKIQNLKDLIKGKFDILEPPPQTPEIDPSQIDLTIVAGIAFDRKGHRIGFGMGYYDRLLKQIHSKKIGLAYEFQIIENVPGKETHDVPVDLIITEEKNINPQKP